MEISTSSIRSMKILQNRYLRYPHFLENREVGFGTPMKIQNRAEVWKGAGKSSNTALPLGW